jgi:hypothetical protein
MAPCQRIQTIWWSELSVSPGKSSDNRFVNSLCLCGFPEGQKMKPSQTITLAASALLILTVAVSSKRATAIGAALSPSASEESNCTTGQAPTPTLIREDREVPMSRGATAASFQIDSSILKEKRRIFVALPASYEQTGPNRRYPVTVVVDGEFLMAPVAVVSDELTRNGQIPESVIIGIENLRGPTPESSNKKRVYDLTPPGLSVSGSDLNQGGDRFLDFIEKELLPAIDRQFRTAAPRTFIGVSSGGVLATYAAATRSAYSAVVSLDVPVQMSDNWLAMKLIARARAGGAPVRYASLEARYGWGNPEWKTLEAKAPKTWKLYREKFQLEGHETMEMLGAYIGLRQVFGDYSRFSSPEAAVSVLPYYAEVGASLGAQVVPPKRVLRDAVSDLLGEGRPAAAREAYNMLVAGYGIPPDSARLLSELSEIEHRPPTQTIEGLLATPFPTPEEAKAILGEWVGDISMGPNLPHTGATTLRIRVVEGRVVGETVRRTDSGEQLVVAWDYLKITARGINWGSLNKRRPHGVMLFEGKLEGDTLSGEGQFAGIKLDDPPPPLHFLFQHVRK